MRESEVVNVARVEFGQAGGFVIWRNSTGFDHDKKMRYGLCVGSSDFIGLGPGGLFLALETKGTTTKTEEEQLRFLNLVHERGGIACRIGKGLKSEDAVRAACKEMIRGIRAGIRRHGW